MAPEFTIAIHEGLGEDSDVEEDLAKRLIIRLQCAGWISGWMQTFCSILTGFLNCSYT